MLTGQKRIKTMRVSINMHTGGFEDTERGFLWSSVFDFFKAMEMAQKQGELWEVYFTVFAPVHFAPIEALPLSIALSMLYATNGRKRPIKPLLPVSKAEKEALSFYEEMKALRAEGLTFHQIAERLNAIGAHKERSPVWDSSNVWKKIEVIKGRLIMRQVKRELEQLCLYDSQKQEGGQAHD